MTADDTAVRTVRDAGRRPTTPLRRCARPVGCIRRNTEEEGGAQDTELTSTGEWWYARDFSSGAVENAVQGKKGALHWVRFRTVQRKMVWDARQFMRGDNGNEKQQHFTTCDHCDSKETKSLSKFLLEVLAFTSLIRASTTLTDAVAWPLKDKLLRMLADYKSPEYGNEDAFYQLQCLSTALHAFAEEERASYPIQSLFSHQFRERHDIPAFDDRCQAVSKRYFPQPERDTIARIVLRKIDPHFQLHCNQENCGTHCDYAWVHCPNTDCPEIMSKIYVAEHDKTCPFAMVSCESCGEKFPRHKEMDHLRQVCPNRMAKCPFEAIGCIAVVAAKDVPQHLTDDMGSHLLLAVNRMQEYESVLRKCHQNCQALETQHGQLQSLLETEKAAAGQRVSSVEKTVQQWQKKVGNLENTIRKQGKKLDALERELNRSHVK